MIIKRNKQPARPMCQAHSLPPEKIKPSPFTARSFLLYILVCFIQRLAEWNILQLDEVGPSDKFIA
ncbi:hypothetical protein ASPWEDRAFT_471351 [Aspergillus wentii DTO 134E9]|uniref:Uncharacterized protein n=1 Tax=Aspergillus wentii DTO 134E9 TaxID=1073089 RepID=A0A1L9RSI0_ASPWE|nr:uncharacterized protein ASPWEDRAFT_471351 [Aspergillus wentii DTO 134E9]OJJ37882.1 hypothetical protein ASPWEDRAFT_471351 [Aspergillus wentii DTO 134E9]